MKKTLFPLLSIFLFSTTAVFGDIPRSNVNKVKQLNWSEIIDAVSQTYQFGIYFSDQVKQDGSTFNYPTDEKYGRLSQNGIGRYLYKDTKFYDYEPFYGAWSVDKQENKICHGNSGDSIDKHICEHLYEGFEMGIKYLYFSETKIFYIVYTVFYTFNPVVYPTQHLVFSKSVSESHSYKF